MINQKQACLPSRDLVLAAAQKVIVDHDNITMQVKIPPLYKFIAEHLQIGMLQAADENKEINIPYITRRAHRGAIVIEPNKPDTEKDPLDLSTTEVRNLVRGLIWRDEHFGGMTLRDIAKRDKFSEGYVGQCIFRTFGISLA
jgi:hypothetical protein